jgi:hypothetical protein
MTLKIKKITDIDWHRNGVGGIGFYAVDFVWSDDDHGPTKARAIIFSDGEEGAAQPQHYAITTSDIYDHWRGDRFMAVLWPMLQKDYAQAV